MENMLSNTPYEFKKSYGGTPEPQTPQDAPCWLRGPSLKVYLIVPGSKLIGDYNTKSQKSKKLPREPKIYKVPHQRDA